MKGSEGKKWNNGFVEMENGSEERRAEGRKDRGEEENIEKKKI